ncbi:Trehalose/maltose import ATP-binding protein MalK [uncultured archaeon]|nr:Trehalose/maltose import ATP-binding protein MalK [uncultured archaeon]
MNAVYFCNFYNSTLFLPKINFQKANLPAVRRQIMTFLTVENLKVQYQTQGKTIRAVDDVTFSLEDKESIGIAGESACGKSTLGMAIMRAVQGGKIVSGNILLESKSILEISEEQFAKTLRWKEISMIFQGAMNSLDPVFTVKQQFEEILKTHHFNGDYQKTISDILISVGLPLSVLQKSPHELSGGMKQKLVISMALILKPKFVVADEPTTALDVLVQAQIVGLLKKLKKNGMSIMLISHDLGVISEIADKVGIMYAGKIVEFGSLADIYSDPKHPYTQALLKSVPKMKGDVNLISLKGEPPSLSDIPKGCRFYERCPKAMDKCKNDPPKIKTKSGYVLCWLYD